jgi:hypothetical protein
VALINQTMARRLWPGEDPIGRKVRTGGNDGPGWRTIIGTVGDVYQYGLDSKKTMQIYLPYKQNRVPGVTLLVRGVRDPAPLTLGLTRAIRAAVAAIRSRITGGAGGSDGPGTGGFGFRAQVFDDATGRIGRVRYADWRRSGSME